MNALASYSREEIADYLNVKVRTLDKFIENAKQASTLSSAVYSDNSDESVIARYFDYERPNIATVNNLTDDHIMKIRACLLEGCPMASLDRYLDKTPGTIARWKNQGRFDDSIVREAERRKRWVKSADEPEASRDISNELNFCNQRIENYERLLDEEKERAQNLRNKLAEIRRLAD